MAGEDVKASDNINEDKKVKGKGGALKKYKWYIVGGSAVVILLIWWVFKSKGSTSSQAASNAAAEEAASQQAQESSIDPATGYPYGSAADLAALGSSGSITGTTGSGGDGSTGAPGPTGPAGPSGPSGTVGPGGFYVTPTGNTLDINRIAQSFGLTEAQLVAANPSLLNLKQTSGQKYYGSGVALPSGVDLNVAPVSNPVAPVSTGSTTSST
jgi:hypothetical protein